MNEVATGFGVMDGAQAAYRLKVRDPSRAALYEISADCERAVVTGFAWSKQAPVIEQDWNRRLSAKGHPQAILPTAEGDILLHQQFGRELDVILSVTTSYQEVAEMARLWSEATPKFRVKLWHELQRHRADKDIIHQAAEWLQEELRFRAP